MSDLCPVCRAELLEWQECEECDGDGYLYDLDPDDLYQPRLIPCASCGSEGGRTVCPQCEGCAS